ncbi:KH homology domain-containing protein 4-like [Corythoichthys intestinalis]|uniref:KH homology domain-containing protein 4-like n=1 Tax=Corythoichthys intestinalis TaxID=161448 RepID=UPI0025A5E6DF|nr:KH homology domain-containing protein 4-like [Corythoichthys intestinalis]XP_061795981.1 KH homology domain-containing protein 4-like [Nerophis lumbriciformis]
MPSGMAGQTPCLTSRWDQPAQSAEGDTGKVAYRVPEAVGTSSSNSSPPTQEKRQLMAGLEKPEPPGGVEMAAAMAAKINAMLMAKGKLLTPPPLLTKKPVCVPTPPLTEDLVVTEVDINDVPINCRDLLTKGKTQEEIRLCSGAVVSTRGNYMSDVEREKAGGQRPLYLHVQAKTQEQVNKAVSRIKEIITEDMLRVSAASGGQTMPIIPPLTLYPQPSRPVVQTPNTSSTLNQGHRPAAPHPGNFVHTKIFVGLEQSLPSFNVNEKVEGPGGTYLGHIQTETGARVFLRGKGSGYIEQASKRESFEPLYVYISHPNAAGLEAAKLLTESLLQTVRAEHASLKSSYTATASTQPYATHGYPPNSNYSSQCSWYNYPANGYAGGYSAYPGAGGYWSNANGPPSHSNMSTTPPSSQAMVQYPVCPRNPNPYLVEGAGRGDTADRLGALHTQPDTGSSHQHVCEPTEEQKPASCSQETPAHQKSTPPPAVNQEKTVERMLMPPPPPPLAVLTSGPRKRPSDMATQAPDSLPNSAATSGLVKETCEKKPKILLDASGLVPYGGDSSDEEEERTRSSKTSNS